MRQIESAVGMVVFSVELELAIDRSSVARQQRLDELTSQLLALLEEQGLRATWAVADPTHSAATGPILDSNLNHELAILGDATWLGAGAGRMRIERELSRRVGGARQAGIPISTLVMREVSLALDLNLLLAQQISAISDPQSGSTASSPAGALRFGVWQAPAPWRLPIRPRWWPPIGWLAARCLRHAARNQQTLHVAIDGDALVDQGERGLAQLAAVIERVSRLRKNGKLRIGTLAEFAAENLAHRIPQPAKSVLCSAA